MRRPESDEPARVLAPTDTATRIRTWQAEGLRVAATEGAFDVLHEGHLSLLTRARAAADRLVVVLHDDERIRGMRGASRPVHPAAERAELAASLKPVDLVTVVHGPAQRSWIDDLRPDIVVLTDEAAPSGRGGEILLPPGTQAVYLDVVPGDSTTAIVDRIRRQAVGTAAASE